MIENKIKHTLDDLRAEFGARVLTSDDVRNEHARDACHHAPRRPDAVVYPEANEEVARVVEICARHRMPIIPFGTGTGVEGGVVAVGGGVCVDLRHMNKILRVSTADMDATVQAGVSRMQLNAHLDELDSGLFFPVDPGADASLGGMSATCASGSSAVRYGTMRENVLGLTAVFADGKLVRTGGRARKSSSGYDLTRLLVGSEGTLGIITEVTLKLAAVPEAISAAVCGFEIIESAVEAVIAILQANVSVAKIELLDDVQMGAVNRYSGLAYREIPTLFFEFHGTDTSVREQAERAKEITREFDGREFDWASDRGERDRLWKARYDSYYASLALRDGAVGYVTDVCVPVSELADCIRLTLEELESTTIPAPVFGHVGDGNFHVVFAIERDNQNELAEVERLNDRIVALALERGGTATGEHGIGIGKLDALEQEHGDAIHVMRTIKQALDPLGILNPGKVLRSRP
jgi:D-lactate dehydrogenase (cytochrome)